MNQNKSIKLNFVYNAILQISNTIIPLITFPYVARILSAEGLGRVNFSSTVIQYFILIAQMGIPRYGVKECAKYRNNRDKLTKSVQEILIINIFIVAISYLVFIFLLFNVNRFKNYYSLLLIMSINILLKSIGIEWFYQSIEEYKFITVRSIIIRIISLGLIFIFIKKESDYLTYGLILTLSSSVGYIYNFIFAKKYIYLFRKYPDYNLKKHLKPIFLLFTISLSVSIYVNIDKVMLGFISGDRSVGLYVAANKMVKTILALITSLGTVLFPRISYYVKLNDYHKINKLIYKSFNFIMMISIPATIGLIMLAKPIIVVFAGRDYLDAIITIKILSPILIIIALSNLIGIQILVSHGKEKLTLISTIIGAIVNFVMNLILIPVLDHNGAAIATVFAEIVVTSFQIYFSYEYLKGNIKFKSIKTYLLGGFFIVVISLITNLLLENIVLEMLCTVIFSILVYFSFLYFVKNEFVFETINKLLKKLKSRKRKGCWYDKRV